MAGNYTADRAEAVISRLKFIARIRPGEKVDIASLSVHPVTYTWRLYRAVFARGESRYTTLDYIRQALDDAFEIAPEFLAGGDDCSRTIGQMIVESLSASKSGIQGLAKTYEDDRMYVARIESLVAILNVKIASLPKIESDE